MMMSGAKSDDPSVPHTFSGFIASLAAGSRRTGPKCCRSTAPEYGYFPALPPHSWQLKSMFAVRTRHPSGPANLDAEIEQAALPSHTDTPSAASSSTARTVQGSVIRGIHTMQRIHGKKRPGRPVPHTQRMTDAAAPAGRLTAADEAGPSSGSLRSTPTGSTGNCAGQEEYLPPPPDT